MNNDKELREKLLTANSGEEIKALLGDQVTEEEADLLFRRSGRGRKQMTSKRLTTAIWRTWPEG